MGGRSEPRWLRRRSLLRPIVIKRSLAENSEVFAQPTDILSVNGIDLFVGSHPAYPITLRVENMGIEKKPPKITGGGV